MGLNSHFNCVMLLVAGHRKKMAEKVSASKGKYWGRIHEISYLNLSLKSKTFVITLDKNVL